MEIDTSRPPPKEDFYKSLTKEASKEGNASTMRIKLAVGEDRCSFKCWDENKQLLTVGQINAVHWPSTTFACSATLKGVDFQINSYWPLLDVTMLTVKPEDEACPLEDDGEDCC